MGQHCIFVINQHKGNWHSIDDFTNSILFIASSTAGSSCCWVYVFCIYFCSNNWILHCIACSSHCICSVSIINLYIGKWVYSRIHLLLLYFSSCFLLSDPNTISKHLHCYHIFSNTTGKHFIFTINHHKSKWHFIDDFTNAILFIASSTAGSSCCWVLRLLYIFAFQQPNPALYCLYLTLYVLRLHHQLIHR